MGGNQVKATHSPLLHVESVALNSQESQERRFRKGLPRRLGSVLLTEWIRMKRREEAIVQKAKVVVNEGHAPPEVQKEVEMYMKSVSKKPHIKYHPTIIVRKVKPTRSRLKGPRLTQTAARRIQDAYDRREKEQQQEERAAQRLNKSRLSVRSHGWTDQGTFRPPKRTATAKTLDRQKRSSSLPPTSTLSLQSITTAESSGIGMSRASSLTSVASARQKNKTFFTRQRARSLGPDDGSVARHGCHRQRGDKSVSPQAPALGVPSDQTQQQAAGAGGGGTSGKGRWKFALKHSVQQVVQQKNRQRAGFSPGKQVGERQKTPKENIKRQVVRPRTMEVQQQPQQAQQENSEKQQQQSQKQDSGEVSLQVPESDQRASPSLSTGEKKEQGSQTRLSGPPRPRRLLLLRPGRNKVKQEEQQEEQKSRGQQTSGCSLFNGKLNPKEKWKQLLRINKKESNNKESSAYIQRQDRRVSLTMGQEQSQGHRQHPPTGVSRRVSTDKLQMISTNTEHRGEQRRHSQPISGRQSPGEYPENISPSEAMGSERIIRVSRQHTSLEGGELVLGAHSQQQAPRKLGVQQNPQGSSCYETEQQQCRRRTSSSNHQTLEEHQGTQNQGDTTAGDSPCVGYSEAIMSRGESRRSSEERVIVESGGHQSKITELALPNDDHSARWSGRSVSLERSRSVEAQGGRTSLERSPNPDEQAGALPVVITEQGRVVEAQGGRRPGSFSGRGQGIIIDRGRPSVISLDHGISQTPLETRFIAERGSPDRMRRHVSMERLHRDSNVEHARNEPPIEIIHGEAPVRPVERVHRGSLIEHPLRDSSTERLHHTAPIERGRRESLVEYTRHDGQIDRVRPDVTGRGAGLMDHGPERMLPRVYQDREHLPGRFDRGYSYETQGERLGRQFQERRYTVGTVEPSYLGAYAERHVMGRLSEPDNRIYSGRITNSRPLDPDSTRGRFADQEHTRPYSEGDYSNRFVDHEPAKAYAERLMAGGRLRSVDDYDSRERGGRFKDAVVPQHSVASMPLVDHRSL